MAVLMSAGSCTSQTPVRNKQTPRLTCLLRPEHLGQGRTVHEPNHTSITNEFPARENLLFNSRASREIPQTLFFICIRACARFLQLVESFRIYCLTCIDIHVFTYILQKF